MSKAQIEGQSSCSLELNMVIHTMQSLDASRRDSLSNRCGARASPTGLTHENSAMESNQRAMHVGPCIRHSVIMT
jgi:hypothetical protein